MHLQVALLFSTAYLPATIFAQTSTVIVITTPLPYQDAQSVGVAGTGYMLWLGPRPEHTDWATSFFRYKVGLTHVD